MAKKAQEWDQPAVVEDQPALEPAVVEDQPVESAVVDQPLVMVRALVPMWGDNEVVPPGTRYHLPQAAAEYLAGLGFVVAEED